MVLRPWGESRFHLFASSSGLLVFRRLLTVLSDGVGFPLSASERRHSFDADNRGTSLSFPILLYQILNVHFSGRPVHPVVDSKPVKTTS